MVLGKQINYKTMFYNFNIGMTLCGFEQGSFYFPTGYIFVMQNAEFAVAAFFTEFIIAVGFFIELCTPFNDFLNAVDAFFYNNFNYLFIAKAIAGNQGIF